MNRLGKCADAIGHRVLGPAQGHPLDEIVVICHTAELAPQPRAGLGNRRGDVAGGKCDGRLERV
eukprot:scaffold52782_cov27-Prasinocladus_malaysianus.AAC.1